MKDERIDKAIRNTLAGNSSRDIGPCPDDSLIAAYLDSSLPSEAKAGFEAHAAGCGSCREILAVSMKLGEETPAALPDGGKRVVFHIAIPVSAVALVFVASLGGILYYRAMQDSAKGTALVQTAEVHAPEQTRDSAQPPAVPAKSEITVPDHGDKTAPTGTGEATHTRATRIDRKPDRGMEPAQEWKIEQAGTEKTAGNVEADQAARLKLEAPAQTLAAPVSVAEDRGAISPPGPPINGLRAVRVAADEVRADAAKDLHMQKAVPSDEKTPGAPGMARARKSSYTNEPAPAVTRKIRDRIFSRASGTWVDEECAKHPDVAVVEIETDSEEYAGILKAYPDLRELRPMLIFWKGRKLLIR